MLSQPSQPLTAASSLFAGDKMSAAMQRLYQRCYAARPLAYGEVAQVPHLIVGSKHRTPPINHLAIHLGD
jgi:hypothetical protein